MSKVLVGVKRVVDYSIKVRPQADKLGKYRPCVTQAKRVEPSVLSKLGKEMGYHSEG